MGCPGATVVRTDGPSSAGRRLRSFGSSSWSATALAARNNGMHHSQAGLRMLTGILRGSPGGLGRSGRSMLGPVCLNPTLAPGLQDGYEGPRVRRIRPGDPRGGRASARRRPEARTIPPMRIPMRNRCLRLLAGAVLLGCAAAPRAPLPQAHIPKASLPWSQPSYPLAKRVDVVDTYHGVEVADPYRWLEDPDSPETRAWIEAQNALTRAHLEGVADREPIRARLTELWDYERFGLPVRRGSRLFLTRNDGLQNQSVLHACEDQDDGGALRVLLDPNTLSDDGTVALAGLSFTQDGRYLAYGLAEAGSDWITWRIRDVASGADLPDTLR